MLDAWGAGQPTIVYLFDKYTVFQQGGRHRFPHSVRELLRGGRVAACSYSTSICRSCRIYVVFVFNKYMVQLSNSPVSVVPPPMWKVTVVESDRPVAASSS